MAFSKEKRIRASHSPVVLRNRLIPLKQRLVFGDNSVKAEIASLELDLKLLISAELEGSKICSRSCWFERGEKPTQLFLQLERERSFGVVLFPRSWILTMSRFLLVRRLNRLSFILFLCRRILSGIQLTLSFKQCDFCEGVFSLTELSHALNLNRSPGLDGLAVNFFFTVLRCFLLPSYFALPMNAFYMVPCPIR